MAPCDLNTLWSCQWNERLDGSSETLECSVGGIDFKHSQTMADLKECGEEVKGDGGERGRQRDGKRRGQIMGEMTEGQRNKDKRDRWRGKEGAGRRRGWSGRIRWDNSWERPNERGVWLTLLRRLLKQHSVFPRGEELKVGAVCFCRRTEKMEMETEEEKQ